MYNSKAYLEIIIGPMYSGKTSKLIEIYKQCKFCNIPVIVINHSFDKRYHDSMLSSHDKNMIPCIQTTNLLSLDIKDDIKIILINEGQFFGDLIEFVEKMLEKKKKIHVC